jgi:hypothetical protein
MDSDKQLLAQSEPLDALTFPDYASRRVSKDVNDVSFYSQLCDDQAESLELLKKKV